VAVVAVQPKAVAVVRVVIVLERHCLLLLEQLTQLQWAVVVQAQVLMAQKAPMEEILSFRPLHLMVVVVVVRNLIQRQAQVQMEVLVVVAPLVIIMLPEAQEIRLALHHHKEVMVEVVM
jgi:hypothetical protein